MKRLLLAATALSVLFTGTVASAQDRYQGRNGRGEYGRDHRDDRRDYRNDRRSDYRGGLDDRRDYRGRGHNRGSYARYARGQRYRGDGAYLSNYSRYGYRAPPRGYRYYRTNQGDIVLAAVATGIIASVIASSGR